MGHAVNREHALYGARLLAHRNYSDHMQESKRLLKEQVLICDCGDVPPQFEIEELLQEEKIDYSFK